MPFKLIEEESGEVPTSHGGLPLAMETCEALGLAGLVKQYVRIKQRNRGYTESKYDEFRDGNVPAAMDPLSSFLRAVRTLPESVETVYFRSDSAAYQHKLLDVMREGVELHGKKAAVYLAISADVSEALRGKILSVSEPAWKPLRKLSEKGLIEGRKEWAEVEFIPSAASVKKEMKPDRYLAIRVRPWQGELFSDGNAYHYYAVVTNRWEMDSEATAWLEEIREIPDRDPE